MNNPSVSHQPSLNPLPWGIAETLFWAAFAVISFLLALYYSEPNLRHVAEISLEIIIGIVLTRPIILSAPFLQRFSRLTQLAVLTILVLVLSQTWNLVRMSAYPFFFPEATYEGGLWDEFGGWASTAFFIFAIWAAVYFGIRAYSLAAAQRELAAMERLRRLNAEKLSSNAQLKMLRYQINPHFIFNTLNSVKALIATKRSQDARAMIDGLSDLLRVTLERDPPLIIPLAEEMETVRQYLNVEKMRFGDRLSFDLNLADGSENIPIPSLLLQPIVENSIRHGVEAQKEGCDIAIDASCNDNRLIISISDTGPGLNSKAISPSGSGIGLENVRARLESVYGEDATLELVEAKTGGVRATISAPLSVPEMFS